ncbi:MAG: hypothetical protein K6G70_07485 [Bacteroidaceae bacterium]|nr:hypothetical protein [Bacteroidaceae bacterium]
MKTKALFLTALTSFALVSCTGSEFLGESTEPVVETTNGAIVFGGSAPAMTRADFYGADAAAKLGNKFVVYGTKHFSAEDKTASYDAVVYNNFQVAWAANTAGKTASNTNDWEYVGLQSYDAAPTAQGIKYWDYSADNGYTFYAFSSSDISYPKAAATDKVVVTKTTADGTSLYNKGYAVTVKNGATLNNLYFSDRLEVPFSKYDQTVNLTFRNLGSKVRVGFYETIPGYTVKIDRFRIDYDATAAVTSFKEMNDVKTDGFYASLQNVKTAADQTINVTYYDATTATQVINRPKVSNPTGGYNYYLKLGDGSAIINKTLATTASSPTWVAGEAANNYYIPIFPFEGNNNPLLLKLDFTMYADDGSADVIHVKGARAIVPAINVQWKSNFAYTYIFKISDKTNGTTGDVDGDGDPTDPEGLKPITFDAIVVDMTEDRQETITSVATNSITTYAQGQIVNEYTASKPIYVAITDNSNASHPVITPTGLGSTDGKAQIYKLNKPATEAEVLGQLTGSPMGITLTPEATTLGTTIPLANGTTPSISNVYFTPSAAATYYAYVYTRTAYAAPTYTAVTTGNYSSSVTYYMQSLSGAHYAVSVPTEAAFEANLAKLSYIKAGDEGTAGVYDVKVIKVQ